VQVPHGRAPNKQIAALTIRLFVCQAKGSILEGKSMDEAAKKISPAIKQRKQRGWR
jgi:hypothetical protein